MGEVVTLRKPAVAVMGPMVKLAAVMFVLVYASATAYFFFFGVFSLPQLTALLQELHVDQLAGVEGRILFLVGVPMSYGILTALAPLAGWWIYSRIETGGQAKVMWGSATLFSVASLLLAMLLTGAMIANPLFALLGVAIQVFYIVFCMGLGFLPAQIFKIKL